MTTAGRGETTQLVLAALHQPLAVAVVGGLAFSTAATLFVVPALSLLLRRRDPSEKKEVAVERDEHAE